ncbi:MAG: NFACT RNA binding domain-containing protein [Helicobacteraceae bacterium]|jgi:predicted ribosome quality control (RQC) complex YloA/Tae2 family protein|nr:NFACT RNA binding domain-containing protein [Helicobacteraceae bacterium]
MKYSELNAIATIFSQKKRLLRCKRVGENRLYMRFEDERWIADFAAREPILAPFENEDFGATFNAPFDQLLTSRASQSDITKAALCEGDKILRLDLVKADGWKTFATALVLEFVPRRFNALLLGANDVILESLRRTTRLQIGYEPPPKPPFAPKIAPIDDIRALMRSRLAALDFDELERKKNAALAASREKSDKIKRLLNDLALPSALENEANLLGEEATLILANLAKIAPYSKEARIDDFDGKTRLIALERLDAPQKEAERKFSRARKLRAKAKGVFQERQNLEERLAFYDRLILAINESKTLGDLRSVLPSGQKRGIVERSREPIEEFMIGGFRVLLGRNEKGNALLLKRAKARDTWLHLQSRPSAHLIVQSAKEELPSDVIKRAAQLCARFSLSEKGDYLVDYTKRQFVKVEYGAHVTYSRQKSVAVRLE